MPQVTVTIAGKSYRMACGEGEEPHLEALAQSFDAKVAEMREAFGEIGDLRLHVMASLTLCDDLAEARARVQVLEDDLATERARAEAGTASLAKTERQVAETVSRAAERLERLARGLAAS